MSIQYVEVVWSDEEKGTICEPRSQMLDHLRQTRRDMWGIWEVGVEGKVCCTLNCESEDGGEKRGLVTIAGAWWVVNPIEDDEWQAANHEDDSHDQEDCRLKRERETGREGIKCSWMCDDAQRGGLLKFLTSHILDTLSTPQGGRDWENWYSEKALD